MAELSTNGKRVSVPSSKVVESLASKNDKPTKVKAQVAAGRKTPGPSAKAKAPCLSKKAKLFQSLIAFVAVCAIYESGSAINKASQQTLAYEKYRSELAKFLMKEGVYAKMEEYRKNEFPEEVMMLAKGVRTLTGADIWAKGESVRSKATIWVANNRSILLNVFSKTKQFENAEDEHGDSDNETCDAKNDDKEKETELELTIP